ncbi:hypothetical protein [Phenylobacterium sp.]|uniref:hypothetical protein n=1 Tax=Phenylobacterium sp. TaxID=1871053 RepID=UPI003783C5CC
MRTILAAVLILLAAPILGATPALAAGGGGGEAPKTDAGQYVDLAPVGLPIVADGQLVNYVFVYVRINLTAKANAANWRAKEPYFRDALVRAGHRAPFGRKDDYQKLDEARLIAALSREATGITGPGVIKSVVVTSQAPRRRVPGPPRPAATPRGPTV